MRKNFLLDTNVLLHDPYALFNFEDNDVIIPIEVIEEIDRFKRNMNELGRNSRMVAHILDDVRTKGKLGEGIPIAEGGTLQIVAGEIDTKLPDFLRSLDTTHADNRLLGIALHLTKNHPEKRTVVVTKNVNLRLKLDALGIPAEDYEAKQAIDADVYLGWQELTLEQSAIDQLREGSTIRLTDVQGTDNEFFHIKSSESEDNSALGRLTDPEKGLIQPVIRETLDATGIQPLNLGQSFAMDALLNDNINLVTLTGKAGTGKTLIAVAAGLRKLYREDIYNRLLVFRPTTPVGNKDLGYLPGEIEDKMRPWMQPIHDALEFLKERDKRSKDRSLPPEIDDSDEVIVEPLAYIRGRSIPHQFIIIDEAQNLTPLEVKTVITRVGAGTKIVLTGDVHQIDNPYIDSLSNGLVHVVDRLRQSKLAAHIGLDKGERSELAEEAANAL